MNSENKVFNMHNQKKTRTLAGKKVAIVGICTNFLLSIAKIAVGLIFGAISAVGDGVNNFFDALSSIVTLAGFKISEKPADSDHPYGHARFEYISAMIVATLILFAGFELAKGSVEKLISPAPVRSSALMTVVLLASVATKLWLCVFYSKSAKKISSPALMAASKDSFYDVITTFFVLVALFLESTFGWRLDGFGGLLVALFIFRGGAGIVRETVDALLGMAGSPKMREDIEKVVGKSEKVLGIHDLLIHDYGPGNCFASVHVEFDRREDAGLCHDIIDKIERECLEQLNVHLVIHHDPVAIDDEQYKNMQKVLMEILKGYDESLSLHDLHIEKTESGTKLIFDVTISDSLMSEKEKITEYVRRKLKKEMGEFDVLITYDPM